MDANHKQPKLTIALSAIYLLALIWIIMFKFQLSFDTLPSQRSINLVPFFGKSIARFSPFANDLLYNTLVFIPYGIYISMLKGRWPLLGKIVTIFSTSLLFELLQYVFGIGASDVNDLIANTAGGVIGLGMYFILSKLFKEKTDKILSILALVATVLMLAFIGFLSLFITYRF